MKKSKPAKLLFGFLGIATFASLVGTVSGTLAWYAYSTRATLSYSGTSVNNTVQLQIGLASPERMTQDYDPTNPDDQNFVEFWNTMEEVKWNDDSNYYYFAPIGSGLTSEVISAYLESNGYATNLLAPVTTGAFERGDSFVLKNAPTDKHPEIDLVSEKSNYAKIPFVFRVLRTNTTTANNFVEDSELWLTDAQVRASSADDGDVYKAIRMYIDRGAEYDDDFILNPSAVNKGETVVAGLLDLTLDHYYDYDENDNEIIYGDYESIGGIKTSYAGADEIADLNGTGKTDEDYDTFTAKHRPGINYYEDYNNCVFKTAKYESLKSIAPIRDEVSGVLRNPDASHPTSLCKTAGAAGHYLGRVDFTVYLEGWDHSIIDEEMAHFFDLGLTFEINKL